MVEDPFGAGTCLILVGLFFAAKLSKMTLLTISDYYRERYGRAIEVVCSLIIILSYLGWVSAQVTALGWCSTCCPGFTISIPVGMVLGTAHPRLHALRRHVVGGVTDFIQMIILVVGLSIIAVFAGQATWRRRLRVIALAQQQGPVPGSCPSGLRAGRVLLAAAITMMFG